MSNNAQSRGFSLEKFSKWFEGDRSLSRIGGCFWEEVKEVEGVEPGGLREGLPVHQMDHLGFPPL